MPTGEGRSLEEDSSELGITVPHSTSDGSTGGGTSLERPRVQCEDLIASEASSRSHEGLELGESVGDRHRLEVGGTGERAGDLRDLRKARVVHDELGDGSLISRVLRPSGEVEGNWSMVADVLLVAQGRVTKQTSPKS